MAINLISWKQARPLLRGILELEQRIVFIGVLICALFMVVRPGAPLLFMGVCILVIGNLMYVPQLFASRIHANRPFPWNWILFIPVLTAVSFLSAFAAIALLRWMRPEAGTYWGLFHEIWKIVVVVCMSTGIVGYAVQNIHYRLQTKNKQLEQAVAEGAVVIAEQEQELHRALEIQRGLLPKDLPQLRGIELAGAWQPARTVGGDYFDVVPFSDTRVGICVGDVSGKGLTAALLMSNLQAAFRSFATAEASPAEVCAKLNAFMTGNMAQGKFITFFYAVLDVGKRTLAYENAGHCPALLFRADGTTEFLRGHGAVLGVIPDWLYANETVQLASGDRLFFYTDGVTEADNEASDEFGGERLIRAAARSASQSAAVSNRLLMEEVAAFCSGRFRDDVTLIVLAIR